MKSILVTFFVVLLLSLTVRAQEAEPSSQSDNTHFAFSGMLLGSVQNWSDLQTTESKIGFGGSADLFGGVDFGDMYIGIGPHFGYSAWSISKTAGNITATASTNVSDFGVVLGGWWEGFYVVLGAGSANVSATAEVGGTSQTVDIPKTISFKRVGLGWKDTFILGISFTNYSKTEVPNNLDRLEFNFGVGF